MKVYVKMTNSQMGPKQRTSIRAPERFTLAALTALLLSCIPATAHEGDGGKVTYASDHAPIGVMADHRHRKGEWMASYRLMHMDMAGNRDGTDTLSADHIATTVPNIFSGNPGMPPTLRVVPREMPMQMHMVGAMYGLSDRVTLLAMGMYLEKKMDHITYQGPAGTTQLGTFQTDVTGIGDTTLGAIIGLDNWQRPHSQVNFGLSLSLPTGSITATDQVLTPMGMTPTLRLPYPMQLGSGTFDLKPSLTGFWRQGRWTYGGQASAIVRLGENDQSYTLGDVVELTGWVAFEPTPSISWSGRLKARAAGQIDGQDPNIMAPVQTANPDNHGGQTVEALIGLNLAGQAGTLSGHRLAVELGLPLHRDLNGPQMETDMTLTLGWQKAF